MVVAVDGFVVGGGDGGLVVVVVVVVVGKTEVIKAYYTVAVVGVEKS